MSAVDRKSRIESELEDVLDPCSCAVGTPVSIVELGLVEEISVTDEVVQIELLLTSPTCMYFLEISEEIEQRVSGLPGIEDVNVVRETEKIWTPNRMNDREGHVDRDNLTRQMEENDIEPYRE